MNKRIRCLVIDDDSCALQILEAYIKKLPNLELIGLCQDPLQGLLLLQQGTIDLLFLDIEMPQISGIQLLNSLQEKPLCIFTTGNPSYALEGYKMDVVDYLLKPFGFDRLLQAVNKVNRRMKRSIGPFQANIEPARLEVNPSSSPTSRDYLLIRSEHKVHRIRYQQILYIQGMREYVAFYLTSGRIFSLLSLKALEKALPKEKFMRIHKSYIVAIDQVNTLEGNQIHVSQEKIPIGSSYREKVLGQIFR